MVQPSSCASLAPSSCSAVPSTTSARTPSWKPRRATGANRSRAVTPSSRTREGSISIVWRSKERFVAGCSAPSTPSRKSAKASDLLGRGTVEDDRRQVEQHAVEQRGPVVLRRLGEVQRERRGAVLEVLQHRLVGGLRVDDLDLRPHVPRTGARRSPRGGEPVEVGRLPDRCDVDAVERRAAQGRPDVGVGRVVTEAAGLAQHGGRGRLPRRCVVRVAVADEPEGALRGLQLLGLVESTVEATREVGHAAQDRPAQWRGSLAPAMG